MQGTFNKKKEAFWGPQPTSLHLRNTSLLSVLQTRKPELHNNIVCHTVERAETQPENDGIAASGNKSKAVL